MAQAATNLRLVEASSTGYARDAWYSHVVETAPPEIGQAELHLLLALLKLVDDATGWVEVSYQKLAKRTRMSERTVRRTIKTLATAKLIQPELIGGRKGEVAARIRYHFPAMHVFLGERKPRREGGQRDHGQRGRGHEQRLTLVKQGEKPAPIKNQESEPRARGRAPEADFCLKVGQASMDLAPLIATSRLRVEGQVMRILVEVRRDRDKLLKPENAALLDQVARSLGLNHVVVVIAMRAAQ